MIPRKLTLKNFLSYQQATLDFSGLHTACICGSNGAGKSSLLEAITWAMWGKSRALTEDDVIHAGATDVRVDFEFTFAQQTYRVIRTRQRGKSGTLQFQIATDKGFRPLGTKGLKSSQEQILANIKLDYDTFITSAYLRQGKADQFMLLKPNDRKDILAKLLKLDQYEELADQAKGVVREVKGQIELLESNLVQIRDKLPEKSEITRQHRESSAEIVNIQQQQQVSQEQLTQLQQAEYERQQLLNQLTLTQSRYQDSQQESDRLSKQRQIASQEITSLEALIAQESVISNNYQTLVALKAKERALEDKLNRYEQLQQQKQELEKQIERQRHNLQLARQQHQTNLQHLENQEEKIKQSLSNISLVAHELTQLQKCRERLNELDRLQEQVTPLKQRRDSLQLAIKEAKAAIEAELNQLRQQEIKLSQQINYRPQKLEALQQIDEQLQVLDNKRNYKERLEGKLQESHNFVEKLKERVRNYEQQLLELKTKQESLENIDAICPLCEQPLDEHHLHQVVAVKEQQQEQIEAQIWSTREDIAKCVRQIEDLKTELKSLNTELAEYDSLQKKYGQLEAELDNIEQQYEARKQVIEQIAALERSLNEQDYAPAQTQELAAIERQLQQLNYDDKTHSLAKEDERKWRNAEIKQKEIEISQTKQREIDEKKPQLLAQLEQIEGQVRELDHNSQQQIQQIEANIAELNYSRTEHNQIKTELRAISSWEIEYQKLLQAQQDYPRKQQSLQAITDREKEVKEEQQTRLQELTQLNATLTDMGDNTADIKVLEQQLQSYQYKLQELSKQQGSLEQSLRQLEEQEAQQQENQAQLEQLKVKQRVYGELAKAFGKTGIQSLMIENILPYLEAESNHLLSRLTGNQLHVKFNTQKLSKSSDKINETLEIIIADSQGTRPYETYSGGEAFRINFAIRLALSKLLAQRAGTSLQLLVIDEGFGTQDQDGCERLIAAINAIASDFACILTVTHMQQFKEAFQTHIEVRKTNQGSQLTLSS